MIGNGQTGEVAQRLYSTLIGIQRGTAPDTFGWMERIS
jgi:branched-chain amino acid aminotransferase